MAKKKQRHKGLIRTTYDVVTPESAEEGDYAESGWVDEEGERLSPAEAVRFLSRKGISEASSSRFHPGIWYQGEGDTDYSTGAETREAYHLYGYTPQQQRRIYEAVIQGQPFGIGKSYTSYGERMRKASKKSKTRSSR